MASDDRTVQKLLLELDSLRRRVAELEASDVHKKEETGRTESYGALSALKESEKRYRTLVETADDVILLTDLEGNQIFRNSAYYTSLGYEVGENLPTDGFASVHQDDVAVLKSRFGELFEHGKASAEYRVRHKDGRWLTRFSKCTLIYDEANKPKSVIAVIRDVSERKQADAIMMARMRLLQTSHVASAGELLQKTLDEAEALTDSRVGFYHFVEPDQATLFLQAWSTNTIQHLCKADGSPRRYPITEAGVWVDCIRQRKPVVHNDYAALPHRKGLPEGHAPIIRELVVPVIRNGAIVAVLGVGNKPEPYDAQDVAIVSAFSDIAWDLVETKLTQEALRGKTEELDKYFKYALDLLCIADTDGFFRHVNDAWAVTLGYSLNDLEGHQFFDFVHPDDLKSTLDAVACLQSQTPVLNFKNRYRRKDGAYRWFEWQSHPEGKLIYAVARDITDKRLAEEALKESENRYRLLFENMSEGFSLNEIITDDEGSVVDFRLLAANAAYERHTGFKPQECIGKTILEVMPAADKRQIEEYGKVALTGTPLEYEYFSKTYGRHFRIRTFRPYERHFACMFEDITDRKTAETRLVQSEEKNRRVLSAISEGILISDMKGIITDCNENMVKMFNARSREELIGANTLSFVALEDVDKVLTNRRRTSDIRSEYTLKRLDGSAFAAEVSGSIIKDDSGIPVCRVSSVRDITERKRAEDKLSESEARLVEAQSIGQVGNWDWNLVTDELYWSEENYRIYGLSPEVRPSVEVFMATVDPMDIGKVKQALEDALTGKRMYDVDMRVLRPDGRECVVNARARVTFDKAGKPVRMLGTVQDITERKERRMLEAILGSMGEGLVVNDRDGRVVYFNRAAEMLAGVNGKDMIGQTRESTLGALSSRATDPGALRVSWEYAMKNLDQSAKFEYEAINSLGKQVIEITLFRVGDKESPLGTGTLLREVTRERETDRMKTEFISIASHELRTPMTGIYGFAELLLTRATELSEGHRKWVETVHAESGRLNNIIEDLLNVSRIEAGRLSLNLGPVAVRPIAESVVEQIRLASGSHTFRIVVPEDFPLVRADGEKLLQVLHNLIDNAVKYSPKGGPVTVSSRVEEEQGMAVFSVSDKGLGIPEDEIPKLFTRFHRVLRPETTGLRGTGLGLYIMKSVVEMMGGSIWVESKVNEGSTFHFSLPIAV